MQVTFRTSIKPDETDLVLRRSWGSPHVINSMNEHEMRDLEFALAQRRAMSRRCETGNGEHSCALSPGHCGPHACRGCDRTWQNVPAGLSWSGPR